MKKTIVFFAMFCCMIVFSHAQLTCNNWLFTPTRPSAVSVGDLDVAGNQITVEAVINRTTAYANGYLWAGDIVSKHNDPTDANYLLRPNSAEITTTTGTYSVTPNICAINLNQTYHVAMVYNGAFLRFYRNGFLMSQVAATGNLFQNNVTTRIGDYFLNVHNTQFEGYINEVRIWNVARTQAQLRANMTGSLPNPTTQTGLLAYYAFDNLLNKQGNAAWNGALVGGATINATNPSCNFVYDSCGTIITPPADCSDVCYWKLTGNNISTPNNIFGTLTNHDVRIQTNATNRGILTAAGNFGWRTTTPSTNFHINSAGHAGGVPSGVRFENLDQGTGSVLMIDNNGYVFDSKLGLSGGANNNCTQLNIIPKARDVNGNLTCSQLFDNGVSVGINTTSGFNYTWSGGLAGTTLPPGSGTVRLDVAGVTRSLAFIATSDERHKSNIKSIDNPRQIISGLKGKTYTWNEKAKAELGADNYKQYGFLAQEVSKVLPEAVIVDDKGNYGINYNSFIPVLTEGQKELYQLYEEEKRKTAALEAKIQALSNRLDQLNISSANGSKIADMDNDYIDQNVPNPFENFTRINYSIREIVQTAYIMITDLNGKELDRYPIKLKGKGNVSFNNSRLSSGIYIYTLVVDGRLIDSKKMILAK